MGEEPVGAQTSMQQLKRSASVLSDESLDDNHTKEESKYYFDESMDIISAEEETRRRKEREWLRRKRQALCKEEELIRRREVKAAKERKRAANAVADLHNAIMSPEEQSRYAAVMGTMDRQNRGHLTAAGTSLGLTSLIGAEDDNDNWPGGFQMAAPRRSTFLTDRRPVNS